MTDRTSHATHCEDRSGYVAFPPFSREDSVSLCGIVEIVPLRKADQDGFVDPKLPPPFPPSKGGGMWQILEWDSFLRVVCSHHNTSRREY